MFEEPKTLAEALAVIKNLQGYAATKERDIEELNDEVNRLRSHFPEPAPVEDKYNMEYQLRKVAHKASSALTGVPPHFCIFRHALQSINDSLASRPAPTDEKALSVAVRKVIEPDPYWRDLSPKSALDWILKDLHSALLVHEAPEDR